MKKITILTLLLSALLLLGCDKKIVDQPAKEDTTTMAGQQDSAIVPSGARVEKLSQDQFDFVEGPAWDKAGSVYFTDIPNNSIYRYNLSSGEFSLMTGNSAGANGLMFNRDNNMLVCEQETGAVTLWDTEGNRLKTIAAEYDGTRFNRPNDLVVDKTDGIYFTDPSWSDERPQQIKGVYYADAQGNLRRLIEDMDKPNGIILSPDESTLYVVDSDSFDVRVYPVIAPGQLGEKSTFRLNRPADYDSNNSAADGLALDTHGNLYITTRFGVQIFTPAGEFISTIEVPESPSNCVFAGENLDVLFITARKNVYAIKLNTRGITFPR